MMRRMGGGVNTGSWAGAMRYNRVVRSRVTRSLRVLTMLVAGAFSGCPDEACDIVTEDDFCGHVEQEDWESVRDDIVGFLDVVQERHSCASGYDDSGMDEFRELSWLDEWLAEKDCVASADNLGTVYESYPGLAEFCVDFRGGGDLIGVTFLVEMSYPLTIGGFSFLEGTSLCGGFWLSGNRRGQYSSVSSVEMITTPRLIVF